MDRIAGIREAEKRSHTELYMTETLYEGNSWLRKPIKTVLGLLPLFEGRERLYVLDLGCGVGRNCIPIAQKYRGVDCRIDCVDIMELAIEQLLEYSRKYGVCDCINGIVMPLEDYEIPAGRYDLILAVSSLEHVGSEDVFAEMLKRIPAGIRSGGIVCLVINSNVSETDADSGLEREVQFEVNLPSETVCRLLRQNFAGWEMIRHTVSRQAYDIPRDKTVRLTTDVVTWVARKPET